MAIALSPSAPNPFQRMHALPVFDVLSPYGPRNTAAAAKARSGGHPAARLRRAPVHAPAADHALELVERARGPVHERPYVVDLVAVGDDPEVHVVAVAHDGHV